LTAIVNHSTSDTGSYDVISVSQLGPNEAVGSRPLARMDGNYGVATATSGSPTLVKDSPANFTAADVGKTILVAGAGAAGADLITTIAGFVSGSTVTLSVNASTNVHDRIVWGTDDAPAWQAAINLAIFRRGGNIVSSAPQNGPGGGANYSSLIGAQLNLTHWKGGSIAGTSGGAGGGNAAFPMLSYLPAVGSLFRATSCFNLNIKDLTFTFENRAYNGDLIYYSSDGSDNSSCLIERCGFFPMNTGASGFPSSLNSYIRLDKTIFSHIDMCSFGEGPVGSAIYLATGYTVQSTITRCNFSHTLNHILFGNADTETVVIDSNTFEPNWGGTAGAIVGAVGNRVRGQLTISNNWFGDFNFGGRCHIENINAYITGATVFGNDFNSPLDQNGTGFGGACFGKCSGGPWDIFGNGIASGFAMIDLTVSTGAEGGRPNNMHFHDNSIGQTTNWFSNGTLADLVAFRFDRSNYIVTGSLAPPFTDGVTQPMIVYNTAQGNLTYPYDHMGELIWMAGAPGTIQVTVPAESTRFIPAGTRTKYIAPAGYRWQFIAGGGVALNSRGANKFSANIDLAEVELIKTTTADTWILLGETAAV
jgi:hypothetical protein